MEVGELAGGSLISAGWTLGSVEARQRDVDGRWQRAGRDVQRRSPAETVRRPAWALMGQALGGA